MSKLSLTLHTFSITGSVAGLFLTPSTPRVSGMKIVDRTLRNIGQPNISKTGSSLREQSIIPNDHSLTKKFKKFPTKEEVLENL